MIYFRPTIYLIFEIKSIFRVHEIESFEFKLYSWFRKNGYKLIYETKNWIIKKIDWKEE